jgi:hypothetical protein
MSPYQGIKSKDESLKALERMRQDDMWKYKEQTTLTNKKDKKGKKETNSKDLFVEY